MFYWAHTHTCFMGVCILIVPFWENKSENQRWPHRKQQNTSVPHGLRETYISWRCSADIYQIALKANTIQRNHWDICLVTNPKLDSNGGNWRDPLGRQGCPFPRNYRPWQCPCSVHMRHLRSSPARIELSGNITINKRHSIFHLLIVF